MYWIPFIYIYFTAVASYYWEEMKPFISFQLRKHNLLVYCIRSLSNLFQPGHWNKSQVQSPILLLMKKKSPKCRIMIARKPQVWKDTDSSSGDKSAWSRPPRRHCFSAVLWHPEQCCVIWSCEALDICNTAQPAQQLWCWLFTDAEKIVSLSWPAPDNRWSNSRQSFRLRGSQVNTSRTKNI